MPPSLGAYLRLCGPRSWIFGLSSSGSKIITRSVVPCATLHSMADDGAASASTVSKGKRKASLDKPISPPPVKRKSAISKDAVASFFTPVSKKPKERTTWRERSVGDADAPTTLLVGRYEPLGKADTEVRRKIAAFDLDSTLIATASGKKFSTGAVDWRWWDEDVPARLRELYADGYRIVILSNQAGLTLHPDPKAKKPKTTTSRDRVAEFKQKCAAVLTDLNLPTTVYAATEYDHFRKPRVGMWEELCKDYGIPLDEVDLEKSFFVGDAGGRTARAKSGGERALAKDFSCSDRDFAHNLRITYWTPEEFFFEDEPREFVREFDLKEYPFPGEDKGEEVLFECKNDQEVVLFCGPPGAGKSTFFKKYLEPLFYDRINRDVLKTKAKCFGQAAHSLELGLSIAVDNTNPDAESRKEWVELARKHKVPIRCVYFKVPKALCEHNDLVRACNDSLNPEARKALPLIAFSVFFSRFQEPKLEEGYQDITPIEFKFRGTEEEYKIWSKYWR